MGSQLTYLMTDLLITPPYLVQVAAEVRMDRASQGVSLYILEQISQPRPDSGLGLSHCEALLLSEALLAHDGRGSAEASQGQILEQLSQSADTADN